MSALGRSCAGVGSALITIVTVIAVAAIGNFALGKSDDNVIKAYLSQAYDDERIEGYVAKLDEAGNTTGDVLKINRGVNISVSASSKEQSGETSFNKYAV